MYEQSIERQRIIYHCTKTVNTFQPFNFNVDEIDD